MSSTETASKGYGRARIPYRRIAESVTI